MGKEETFQDRTQGSEDRELGGGPVSGRGLGGPL